MLIDCDVHHPGPTQEEWLAFLDEPYRSEFKIHGGPRRTGSGIRGEDGGNRWDVPSKEPADYIKHHLDVFDPRFVILSGVYGSTAGSPDPDYSAALCKADNDRTIANWLPADDRFMFGIRVPLQDPDLAVAEIERLADHPRAVCVLLFSTSNRIPLGQRYYWPIFRACERHNLPIHIHPSTTTVICNYATTPAGMATSYLETKICLPQFYMANLVSLVLEGVFEMCPNLKIAFVEGGFAWVPHLMWRMDKDYKALRQQAPRLKRLPSEYLRDHVKFTTQPIEEPQHRAHLGQIIDMMGGPEMLMYTSDFPHYDFDPPSAIPKSLGEDVVRMIMHDNAAGFFRWPTEARV
ncbi:MAG: amidohydrolase family protein [bacterium]|nr:amidohydrolase family protein [bacterium]